MNAQEYLDQLKMSYCFFDDLIEIALMPYRDPDSDVTDREANDNDIPRHFHDTLETVLAKYGSSLSVDDRDYMRKHLVRQHLGQDSDVEWTRKFHKEFLEKTSDHTRKLLTEEIDIAVGELQTSDFNGSALEVPGRDNAWVATLNEGLRVLLYGFARALASTFNMESHSGGEEIPPTLSVEDAAQKVAETVRYYVHLGVPLQNDYEISLSQIELAAQVTEMAGRFVYAHEISHILLGHTEIGSRQAVAGDYEETRQLTLAPDHEHEADILSWNLLVHIFLPSESAISPAELQEAYAGAWLFLRVAGVLEHAEDLTAVGTHPPAAQRLEYLRAAALRTARDLGVQFENLEALAAGLDGRFERLMERCPPLPGSSPLEELMMSIHTAPTELYPVMARGRARSEVTWLLAHAAPNKLCRELGRSLGRAEVELKALGIEVHHAPRDEDRRDFTAAEREAISEALETFTLIAGIVEAYLGPEIRRFIDRYHEEYLREVGYDTG